jgi:hypothetical protein
MRASYSCRWIAGISFFLVWCCFSPPRLLANEAPTISIIPDQILQPGSGPVQIRFFVSDIDTPVKDLTITALSENTNLLANTNIVLTGTGTNRLISLSVSSGVFGTTRVTVTVSDGIASASTPFNVSVQQPQCIPVLSSIPDQVFNENAPVLLNIRAAGRPDCFTPASTFFVAGDNAELFPPTNLVLTRTAINETTLSLVPATNRIGRARITVGFTDGEFFTRQSFLAMVKPSVRAGKPVLSGANVILSFSASATGDLTLEHSPDLHVWTPIGTNRTAKSLLYATPIPGSEAGGFFRAKLENAQ